MKNILRALLAITLTAGVLTARAEDTSKNAKPYPLDHCVVSDQKFEGSKMKPHEFVHEGQTIKLCCESCLPDFQKDPAKYLKKIEDATN